MLTIGHRLPKLEELGQDLSWCLVTETEETTRNATRYIAVYKEHLRPFLHHHGTDGKGRPQHSAQM
jgi:hypothetical protein